MPSVHAGAARFGSGQQRAWRATQTDSGHDAFAARSAARMSVSRALSERAIRLRQNAADASANGGPIGSLPSSVDMSGAVPSMIAPRTTTGAQPALIELKGVSKRFVKPLDVAERIGNVFGAAIAEEVVHAVGEAPVVHRVISAKQQVEYVGLMLNKVGLDPTLMRRYPHQFSGGQRARIGIARTLAVKPEFIVCDESVAALDVSIQAQVLNLFIDLKAALNLTYLFISHDLGVVQYIADRVVVMYLGRVVESAPAAKLFNQPNHPYTKALLAEIGRVEPKKRQFAPVVGEIPSPLHPPSGCHFHPRCPYAMPVCSQTSPALIEVSTRQWSACHLNTVSHAAGR